MQTNKVDYLLKLISFSSILILCLPSISTAQQSTHSIIDSLLLDAQKDNPPKVKFEKELKYINQIQRLSSDSALILIDKLIDTYKDKNFAYAVGRAKSMKAWYLLFVSKYEESLKIGHEALELQLKNKDDSLGIGLSLNRIGLANLEFGRYKDAEKYMSEALEYFTMCRDTAHIDMVINNLGVLASEQNQLEEAIGYYKKSLALRIILKDYYWIAYSYYNICESYLNINTLDSAEKYLFKAYETFSTKTKAKKVPGMVLLGMAEFYRQKGNFPKAIEFAIACIEDADTRGHTEMLIEGNRLLADAYYQNNQYKEAYLTEVKYKDLMVTFDSLNNEAQVAEIEERYQNAEKEVKIAHLEASNLEAKNAAQKSKLFTLYTIVAALFFIFTISLIYYRKRQKQKIHKSQINAKIAEIKLIALRSQMNPHFIFNCINTAQNFVLDAKKEDAYEYLAKFARLLRMVLENSSKSYIPIEDEISQIRLYVELESIRFSNAFNYEIIVDPALEDGVVEIPAMFIQAFVENAIIHGLVNLDTRQGKLVIELKLKDNCLYCKIEDNGVGRKAAKEIKKQKEKHYQSVAIPNIRERLEIMQEFSEIKIDMEIIDLEESDAPQGTLIQLRMPVK